VNLTGKTSFPALVNYHPCCACRLDGRQSPNGDQPARNVTVVFDISQLKFCEFDRACFPVLVDYNPCCACLSEGRRAGPATRLSRLRCEGERTSNTYTTNMRLIVMNPCAIKTHGVTPEGLASVEKSVGQGVRVWETCCTFPRKYAPE